MNRDEIMERVGAENWEMVKHGFSGQTAAEIESELDTLYPMDDNGELAQAIYNELS